MKISKAFIFIFSLLSGIVSFPAGAQVTSMPANLAGNIVVRGPGGASCGMYLSSPPANRGLFAAWVQGYLTAYNQYLMGSGDIAGGMSNEQIFQGIDNYCRLYPQDSFETAMSKLIVTFKGAMR
jgi:hypothetical protein